MGSHISDLVQHFFTFVVWNYHYQKKVENTACKKIFAVLLSPVHQSNGNIRTTNRYVSGVFENYHITAHLLSSSVIMLFPVEMENTERSYTFTPATQAVMSVWITSALLSINAIFCYWENVWQWKDEYSTPSKALWFSAGKHGCKAAWLWSLTQVNSSVQIQ